MGAVSVIDEHKNFRTFRLTSLAQYGSSKDLLQRLKYVSEKILPFLLRAKRFIIDKEKIFRTFRLLSIDVQ
jgi:polo-like kinase 1